MTGRAVARIQRAMGPCREHGRGILAELKARPLRRRDARRRARPAGLGEHRWCDARELEEWGGSIIGFLKHQEGRSGSASALAHILIVLVLNGRHLACSISLVRLGLRLVIQCDTRGTLERRPALLLSHHRRLVRSLLVVLLSQQAEASQHAHARQRRPLHAAGPRDGELALTSARVAVATPAPRTEATRRSRVDRGGKKRNKQTAHSSREEEGRIEGKDG